MRGIKFRAWDKERNTLVNNIEPRDFCSPELQQQLDKGAIELMQYIGIKDKNDVEICDGDFVRYNTGEIWLTEWSNKDAGFHYKNVYITDKLGKKKPSGVGYAQLPGSHEVEIIGNIYENPDLKDGSTVYEYIANNQMLLGDGS